MISFESDYICGAHPAVLQRLLQTNLDPQPGYGDDRYTALAREKILHECGCEEGDVRFLAGGTQTNAVVAASLLKSWQGVIAADSGHIHAHEAGAIEAMGCKVLTLPQHEGRLDARELRAFVRRFYSDENREHMVFPGLVYLSHPTEWGTLYSLQELKDISNVCREFDMRLFVDGARLGYGLMSRETDVSLQDLAGLCDAFYIGGTKVGALCGEAVVFPKGAPAHFLNFVKKHGALLAKGRLIGVQFDALFTDGLYYEIGRHGIEMADRLKEILKRHEVPFYLQTPTNQQFALLEDRQLHALRRRGITPGFWEKADKTHTVVRFATSWSTTEEDLAALDRALG